MNIIGIILLAIALTLILAFVDTKDHRLRPGTPFNKNILPNAIRVAITIAISLLILPKL